VLFTEDLNFNLLLKAMKQDIQLRLCIPHQDSVRFISPNEGTIPEIILN
jgi:hypothetical protein